MLNAEPIYICFNLTGRSCCNYYHCDCDFGLLRVTILFLVKIHSILTVFRYHVSPDCISQTLCNCLSTQILHLSKKRRTFCIYYSYIVVSTL